ncbi:CSC1-like protein ERD4 [Arachis stenosperma]|uniref:CSC1-like protein ERD4 n=1 Tax=Arachis stenosperma TaxID=217475 RepID=UPI0025AC845E|nr:CSC1-like protein ERD4 [Arachis stenosperma]
MDLTSFVTSLGTYFGIFMGLMIVYAFLSWRAGNNVVYYPNKILKGLEPLEGINKSRNPFIWMKVALVTSETEVIALSGVDTAVYFVFLSTVLSILVLSAVILLPVLLPVAVTDERVVKESVTSHYNQTVVDELQKLTMGNITEKSNRLWAFFVCCYWFSLVALGLLWKACKHVSWLRAQALMAPNVKPEQFAVVVRDIPAVPLGETTTEEYVHSYFEAIYPETYYKCMIVTDNRKANRIWEELEGYKKQLARAETVFQMSKTNAKPEGTRPTIKTGLLGLCGSKVDSIEYYNDRINETVTKLEAEQKITQSEKQQNAALVFFTSRVVAASAAQSLHAQMVDTWSVSPAAEPRQLIWHNLTIKYFERELRKYLVNAVVALTIVFYMVPISFISAFTTLQNLVELAPFIEPVVRIKALRTVLEAYLPQLALIIFFYLLPKLLLYLSKLEGIPTQSQAVRAASGKYFYFPVVNVFLGVTLGGTLYRTFKLIEDNPKSLLSWLVMSLPDNATFFLTYLALKFFVGYGLELSRLVPLLLYHFKRKYICKTDAERKEAWAPGDLGYETRVSEDMLIVIIVFCYSVIAPLIIPFGVLYFGLGWLILRNQALNVYVPTFESNGRMWPHIHNRILASLILYQVTMLVYFGLQKFYYASLLIPLPILSFIYGFVCAKKFYPAFERPILEVVANSMGEAPDMELIFRSFIPPSLNSEKIDDENFEESISKV